MTSNNNVCRFCLKLTRDANMELVNEVTQKKLVLLLIKLNLEVSEDPMICKMCSGILDEIYKFKSTCLRSEDVVSAHFKNNLKVNLRDILIDLENEPSDHLAEDEVVCRLCIKIPPNGNYITLNENSDKVSRLKNIIQLQLPEIGLSFTEEPVICEACDALLENYFSFATSCMDVEQKIKVYCEYLGSNVKEPVDLLCVLQFTANKAMDCESCPNGDLVLSQGESFVQVKVEKVEEDKLSKDHFIDSSSTEFCMKIEEVDIKSEDDQIRMETGESDQLDDSDSVETNNSLKNKTSIIKNESEAKVNDCPKCSYSSKYNSKIKRHMLSHSSGKIWECCLCPFTADNLFSLRTHMTSHKGPTNLFGCTECPYEARSSHSLVRHRLIHKDQSKVELHKCALCPYKGKSTETLRQHRKRRHDENIKIYQCKECLWSSKYKRCVLRHQSMHKNSTDIPKHKCEKCEHEAKFMSRLAIHMLTHEEGKFACEECPYRGKRRGDLRRHMMIHSNQSSFSCDQCTFSTHAREYLLKHKRIYHKGPKVALQCNHCDFHAKNSRSLCWHKKMHHSTKPKFKCEKCKYSTYDRSRLNTHLVSHMDLGETVVYYCATCDFKTKYKNSLKVHVEKCSKKEKNDDKS